MCTDDFELNKITFFQIIWNSSTRGELLKFVDEQRTSPGPDGSYDLTESQSFTYKALSEELNVGNVYLRVYNNQPDFEISDQEEFCIALLKFVAELVHKWNSVHSIDTSTFEKVSDSTNEGKEDTSLEKQNTETNERSEVIITNLQSGLTSLQVLCCVETYYIFYEITVSDVFFTAESSDE
jgi:DnaJ homolog subfamily C member 13